MATIKFTAPRAHSFPYCLTEIKENTLNSFSYIQLRPGVNLEFSDLILEKIKLHPDFKNFQDAGLIVVSDDETELITKDLGGVEAVTSGKHVGDGEPLPVGRAKVIKSS